MQESQETRRRCLPVDYRHRKIRSALHQAIQKRTINQLLRISSFDLRRNSGGETHETLEGVDLSDNCGLRIRVFLAEVCGGLCNSFHLVSGVNHQTTPNLTLREGLQRKSRHDTLVKK